jgi:class 3 adenylate cyclase
VDTQTVTALFTDLVGSTELSSRLGPDATEALRQTHYGLLRGAVNSAGGIEVKSTGDGLMVVFTSLSRALACAVAMQQAIDRHNRRGNDAPLSVRIGISTGEATEGEGDYYGDCIVEAARLCALAEGGQILATAVVQLIAGRHATQEFVSVGDLTFKGIPDPVPSVEVVWEPAVAAEDSGGQLPLPARLVGASAESLFAFFGRATELARLTETQKASAAEQRLRVTLISGEPGIGKTTLVAQAARGAHAAGANVLYGHCEEGLGVPYQPWITALSQLVEHTDEAVLRAFVDAKGLALARLLPDLARRLSMPVPDAGSDADSERFLILEGVTRLLAMASTTTPIVLVLDDLHWVDAASLQLLRHLVSSATPMSVLVVGTYRESDLSRSHPLVGALADLRREACVDRIDLVGLEDVEIIDLLGAAAGHHVADDGVALAHALRRETAGNPFFLVEDHRTRAPRPGATDRRRLRPRRPPAPHRSPAGGALRAHLP